MSFKSELKKDLNVFINSSEFADEWTINEQKVIAVFDNSLANSFEGAQIQGVFKSTAVVEIKQGDLTPLPLVGSVVTINKLRYKCRDVRTEQGIDYITLEMMEQ